MKPSNNICAVVPAYNAEKTIRKVVIELKKISDVNYIIVVNDGSSDDTNNIKKESDIIYLAHKRNLGKGAALKSGFKKALELNSNIIITLDADFQHNPKEIRNLLENLIANELDIVIGSRFSDTSKMPLHRILSNKITSKLISWRVGKKIKDSQSGFRAIKAEVLKNIILKTNRFELESEILIKALLNGYKVGFTDIETIYYNNQKSFMKFSDIFRFMKIYVSSYCW